MNCPLCGSPASGTKWLGGPDMGVNVHLAMNTQPRLRACERGHKFKTVEIDAAELASLRRLAYLQLMREGRDSRKAGEPVAQEAA